MELAIPIIALGWLYVASNQQRNQRTEGMTVNAFPSLPPVLKNEVAERPTSDFVDMAGRKVDAGSLAQNMVPYIGRTKKVGPDFRDQSESQMDAMTGMGALQISKTEMAPLFKPEENVQWANGAPNETEFFRSRVNPSMQAHNTKPWEEQRVAPGLNQGFGNNGSGGFNSGMEARDKWLDKTVNELRVATKPKVSFDLANHEGPSHSLVKNMGYQAPVEKHLPDGFFVNTPDRYLTTVTNPQATLRSIQPEPTVHRATTSKGYAGIAAAPGGVNRKAEAGKTMESHRQQLPGYQVMPAKGMERNNLTAVTQSFTNWDTNRNSEPAPISGLQSLVSAVTAPLMDVLRPSRKENTIGNKRLGNAGGLVPTAPIAPENVLPTTIRDTTSYSAFDKGQRAFMKTDGVLPQNAPDQTKRSMNSVSYMGGGAFMNSQTSNYDAAYAAVSKSREANGRAPNGSMATFTPIINQTTYKSKQHTSYLGAAAPVFPLTPEDKSVKARPTYALQNQDDRNTPDLLQAFKNNPYTHSLHSVA
jgi:hypothetical protein